VISIPLPQVERGGWVAVLALSACGGYLAGSGETPDSFLYLWEVRSGRLLTVLHGSSPYLSLAFSPDSLILASSEADGPILLWDLKPYVTKTEGELFEG